jgi:predicted Zn-dependent peptidase
MIRIFITAQVYAMALGGGMSSRLFQEAREKRGLCYTIQAFAQASTDTGMIGVYTGTGEAEAGEISAVIAGEMAALAEGATEVEVARAKAQMKSGMLMGLERPSSRTEQIASNLLAYGRVVSVEEMTAKLDAVDAEAVRRFGARLMSSGSSAMAAVGPIKNLESYDLFAARFGAGLARRAAE